MTWQRDIMAMPLFDRLLLVSMAALVLALGVVTVALPWYIAMAGIIFGAALIVILRQPFIGALVIAFFLPFERLGAYELGDTTIRISQIVLIATVAAWLIQQIFVRRAQLVRNPPLLPLAAFLVVNVLSLTNSINTSRSIIVFVFTVFTASLAFLIPNLIRTQEQVRRLVLVLLVGFVLVSAFGLYQFAGDMLGLPTELTGLRDLYTNDVLGFTRVQSTAYEPLYFANYLLLPLAIVFALFLAGRSQLPNSITLGILGLGAVALVLTVSRGGYAAAAAMVAVVSLFYLRRVLRPEMITLFIILVAVVGWAVVQSLGVGDGMFTLDRFEEHVVNVFYGASFDERVYTFEQAAIAWREHPLVGIGVGAFGPWAAPHPQYMPEDGWLIVNNEFIEILAETGILGLLAFLTFLGMLVVRSLKAIRVTTDPYMRAIMVATLAALVGVIVQYQSFSTLYIMHIWFLFGLMIAVQNIILHANDKPAKN